RRPPRSPPFPYTTLFRSVRARAALNTLMMSFAAFALVSVQWVLFGYSFAFGPGSILGGFSWLGLNHVGAAPGPYSSTIPHIAFRSEEHTSELQSPCNLVC